MSKVATANMNANIAIQQSVGDDSGDTTSKRKAPGRGAPKDRNARKSSPDNARTRVQTKRKKKKGNKKEDSTNDKTSSAMEEDTEDQLVVEDNEENEDEEQTDSDHSITDSNSESDSDNEELSTNQNSLQDDTDDDEDDEDEVMDDDFYARRRRSLLGYNASFNYTRLAIEKLTDHPIVLRGCDTETLWDRKELAMLQEDLRILYKKARQRIKTMKRDVRKLDHELQRKRDLASKRPISTSVEGTGLNIPYTDQNGNDFVLAKNKDVKQRVCGVMNSRGNPCQRTGFCPFHHKLTNSRVVNSPTFHGFYKRREDSTNYDDSGTEAESALLASGPKERQEKIQVSILLVAAAALERTGIDESDVMKDDPPQQVAPMQQDVQQTITQIHKPALPADQYTHEPPHQHPSYMHDSIGSTYHYSSIQPPTFPGPLGQLPSLHDLAKQPPPPFSFTDIQTHMRNEPESLMHGLPRNNAM
jgi:hypothetical protein